MGRISRIVLQFLSQLEDVIVYSAGAGIVLISPDFVQEFVSADGSPRILDHKF
jgi:hypothetical protein